MYGSGPLRRISSTVRQVAIPGNFLHCPKPNPKRIDIRADLPPFQANEPTVSAVDCDSVPALPFAHDPL